MNNDFSKRLLKPNEIEVRVKNVGEKYAQFLLYKTARTDMDILDEIVGPYNWQSEYKVVKENLYAGIGIRDANGEWVWKWDCGVESRVDTDGNEKKGEASDAFKRAGFKWGIGRELYTSPKIAVLVDSIGGVVKKEYNGKSYYYLKNPYAKYRVRHIEYSESGSITKLSIVDERGNEVWSNIH